MNKLAILADLKRVAGDLKRAPTRDEYHRGKLGQFSESLVKKIFGTFPAALAAAGLTPSKQAPITDPAGLKIAQLNERVKQLERYNSELEERELTTTSIRDLIGGIDTSALGKDADWIKGARSPSSGITGIPMVFFSDFHWDEVVQPTQIDGMNEYNRAIAIDRLRYTFKTSVELLKYRMDKPKYEGIVLALGGDMFSGFIHEELAETNEATLAQGVFNLADNLIPGIEMLAEEFLRVFIPVVVGNHPRLSRKPRAKNRVFDNFDWILGQILARHFKDDDRISFLIPDGPDANFQVYEKRICLTHGDQFRGGAGIAGIFSPLMLGMARKQRRQQAVQRPFDIMMMGHWHQYIQTEQLIINGSLKGYDEYAYLLNLPFERPQQAVSIIHPERGVTFRFPVICNGYEKLSRSTKAALTWG